ncbi:MAG: hypothetical protein U0232_16185 [Thermomicrobiales bacterium]
MPRRRRRNSNRFLDNVGRDFADTMAMFGIAILLLIASVGIVGLTVVRRMATTADNADRRTDLLRGDRRDAGAHPPGDRHLTPTPRVSATARTSATVATPQRTSTVRSAATVFRRRPRLRAVEGGARHRRVHGDHARRHLPPAQAAAASVPLDRPRRDPRHPDPDLQPACATPPAHPFPAAAAVWVAAPRVGTGGGSNPTATKIPTSTATPPPTATRTLHGHRQWPPPPPPPRLTLPPVAFPGPGNKPTLQSELRADRQSRRPRREN